MSRRVLYLADPMCSWCWGFSPVIAEIARRCAGRAAVRVVVGGLRVGATTPMGEALKDSLRHHWRAVENATGQPFDHTVLERADLVYDTEPACRAVVAVRSFVPDATLRYVEAVQRAFYVNGNDVTSATVLARIAGDIGIDADAFGALFAAADVVAATRADFRLAATIGAAGFPSVLLQDGTRYAWLTEGYRPAVDLLPAIDAWLSPSAGA